jgi:hypothetical protein
MTHSQKNFLIHIRIFSKIQMFSWRLCSEIFVCWKMSYHGTIKISNILSNIIIDWNNYQSLFLTEQQGFEWDGTIPLHLVEFTAFFSHEKMQILFQQKIGSRYSIGTVGHRVYYTAIVGFFKIFSWKEVSFFYGSLNHDY